MPAKRLTPIFATGAIALWKRNANRCILVKRCKPVSVPLCGAEELLHLVRRWRCRRPVRIEWPCELTEEVVELLLAHGDRGCRGGRSISECPNIPRPIFTARCFLKLKDFLIEFVVFSRLPRPALATSSETWRAFRCSHDSCVLIWSLNLRMIFKSFTAAPSKSRARKSRIGFSSVSSNSIPDFVM